MNSSSACWIGQRRSSSEWTIISGSVMFAATRSGDGAQ